MWVSRVRGVGELLVPPQPVDAPLPGDHLAAVGHQEGQEVELLAREVDRHIVDHHLAPTGIESHGTDMEHLVVLFGDRRAPTQYGPHPGDELAQPKRLGHIIAGPELEAEHDVDF